MQANVGDRVIITSHRVGEPERDAEVLDVKGSDGAPPYLVRWGDSGHVALFFPGRDARIQHLAHRDGRARRHKKQHVSV